MGQSLSLSECSVCVADATWSVLCMGLRRLLPRWAGNLLSRWIHLATVTDSLSLSLDALLTICYSANCFSYKALGSALRFGRRFWELPELDRIVNVRSYMAFCLDGEWRQSGMGLQRTACGKCFPFYSDTVNQLWYSEQSTQILCILHNILLDITVFDVE